MNKNYYNLLFIRFLAVGVLNAAFGYSCYWVLLTIGMDYKLALLLGNTAGVLFNFKTTGRLVFKSSGNSRIVRFLVVYAIVYGANVAVVHTLAFAGINLKLGAALAILPMAALSFLLNRYFVFGGPAAAQPDPPR